MSKEKFNVIVARFGLQTVSTARFVNYMCRVSLDISRYIAVCFAGFDLLRLLAVQVVDDQGQSMYAALVKPNMFDRVKSKDKMFKKYVDCLHLHKQFISPSTKNTYVLPDNQPLEARIFPVT